MCSIISAAIVLLVVIMLASGSQAYWVSLDRSNGKLNYQTTANGDRIMDFSAVGYKGSAARFPKHVPVREFLRPFGGDDTKQVQDAIDAVSRLPLDARGLRGVILLAPGSFNVSGGTLRINASGVIISGHGTDRDTGTVLNAYKLESNVLFEIGGGSDVTRIGRNASVVATAPAGSAQVVVDCTEGFAVGDHVVVGWQWTSRWIEMMNMTEYWTSNSSTEAQVERIVKGIRGNAIIFDVPLPFRIDLEYVNGTAFVQKFTARRIMNVGLQRFRAVKEAYKPHGGGCFMKMYAVQDSWLSDLVIKDFGGRKNIMPGFNLLHATMFVGGKRVTIQKLKLFRSLPAPPLGYKPFDIALEAPAQQVLVRDIETTGDNEISFMTNDEVNGPNVFYNCTGYGKNKAQPHARFATGLLYDNVKIREGEIGMINRGADGNGQGIAIGYGVAWNCETMSLSVINPPGAANWALGCKTNMVDEGGGAPGILAPSDPAIPSLFLAQRRAKRMPELH